MESGVVRFDGPEGACDAVTFRPAPEAQRGAEVPVPGVLLISSTDSNESGPAGRVLADAGYAVLVPDLTGSEGDRASLALLEAAAAHMAGDPTLDAERLAAVGRGAGGTLAFLLGCHSRRLAAVVDLQGPVQYAELGPLHPVQPLEMALNLSCPLLTVFGEDDPRTPPSDVEALRERLEAFARPATVTVLPEVPEDGALLRAHVLPFLDDVLGSPLD